jgi:hypothetical protein
MIQHHWSLQGTRVTLRTCTALVRARSYVGQAHSVALQELDRDRSCLNSFVVGLAEQAQIKSPLASASAPGPAVDRQIPRLLPHRRFPELIIWQGSCRVHRAQAKSSSACMRHFLQSAMIDTVLRPWLYAKSFVAELDPISLRAIPTYAQEKGHLQPSRHKL